MQLTEFYEKKYEKDLCETFFYQELICFIFYTKRPLLNLHVFLAYDFPIPTTL